MIFKFSFSQLKSAVRSSSVILPFCSCFIIIILDYPIQDLKDFDGVRETGCMFGGEVGHQELGEVEATVSVDVKALEQLACDPTRSRLTLPSCNVSVDELLEIEDPVVVRVEMGKDSDRAILLDLILDVRGQTAKRNLPQSARCKNKGKPSAHLLHHQQTRAGGLCHRASVRR
jgi:hypothetical protein